METTAYTLDTPTATTDAITPTGNVIRSIQCHNDTLDGYALVYGSFGVLKVLQGTQDWKTEYSLSNSGSVNISNVSTGTITCNLVSEQVNEVDPFLQVQQYGIAIVCFIMVLLAIWLPYWLAPKLVKMMFGMDSDAEQQTETDKINIRPNVSIQD